MYEMPENPEGFSVLEPKGWDDYVPFARWLIYKKLLIALLILIILLLAGLAVWLLRPKPVPDSPGIPVYYYLDDLLKLYSGEVILVDEGERVIYRGHVQDGLRSGWGRHLFALDGSAKYEGEFRGDLYEGAGTLFDDYGALEYKGQFSGGLPDGKGILFKQGVKSYEGDFAGGLPDGDGVLYDESGNIRYQGGFARGMREGEGLETDSEGFPVYEGGFRGDLYDGQGVLYTTGGSKLRFEGVFIRGNPSRMGKIYNLQGQLLYDGAVYGGKVDCISLLGLGANDWKERISEKTVTYFGNGFVGYLYGELGVAAIGIYEVEPQKPAEVSDIIIEEQESPPPFSNDDIILYTMLLDGQQYAEQLPLDDTAQIYTGTISGFEAFMASRVEKIRDPTLKTGSDALIKRIDDNTYEVSGLPDTVDFGGDYIYRDLIYYYYGGKDLSKGGVPDVIHCRKKQFGG